jgi:peptide/nickel transport system ATP-binding protein
VTHDGPTQNRGETLAILGESGSGKSVSASAVMNLIDMPPGKITSGRILLNGRHMLKMSAEAPRAINGARIAMIFQDPLADLNPVYSVGWQIAEMATTHGGTREKAAARALDLLRRVGVPEPVLAMRKYPHQFSGGQRQRLMIAMAPACKLDILIADEPTPALDVTVQAQVLALLEELQQETGMGLLLITHDLGVVAEVADRVVVMNAGRIVETGDAAEVYRNPKNAYTRKLIDAAPGKGAMPDQRDRTGQPLLRAEGLQKHYGQFHALKGVDLTIMSGETVAVVGESSSGKSTLARAILRLDDPDAGRVLYRGKDLMEMAPRALFGLRRDLQMVFQDPTQSLNPRMTVFQLIAEAWAIHRDILPKARWKDRVAELLAKVGLKPEMASRHPHQFSGQRQRIAIARALAMEPKLNVCDETVSALDVSIQAQVIALLEGLRCEFGLSYLFIAHDLPVVRDFADRVIVMKAGEIVEEGPVRQIFEAPREAYTRALLAASLDPDPEVQAARRAARAEALVA